MSGYRVRYQTYEFGELDIHVRALRDRGQFHDEGGAAGKLGISSALWPLFGMVWPSGQVLAHLMLDFELGNKRILEVGCGLGLASLVLNHRLADITTTDYHPEAGNFLRENVKLNNGRDLPFVCCDWSDDNKELGRFDLIIGSDLLYEDEHVVLLSGFIQRHANPHCEVIIVDPGRSRQGKFDKSMVSLGFSQSHSKPKHTDYLTENYKGSILRYW